MDEDDYLRDIDAKLFEINTNLERIGLFEDVASEIRETNQHLDKILDVLRDIKDILDSK
jgi:hypothetical protein